MALSLAPLNAQQSEQFDAFYEIYSLSFPLAEQKNRATLLQMCKNSDYTILAVYDEITMVGFCILYHPSDESFYLLEYIAVAPDKKGLGIGKYIFTLAMKHLFQTHGTKPLLIEIDSTKTPSLDNALRIRRERFYRDLGCRKIEPFTYILGLKSNSEPILMELLIYHPNLEHISKKMLKQWIEALYTLVYECEKNDPRIAQMFSSTPSMLHII